MALYSTYVVVAEYAVHSEEEDVERAVQVAICAFRHKSWSTGRPAEGRGVTPARTEDPGERASGARNVEGANLTLRKAVG
jgi:hypothetical protein